MHAREVNADKSTFRSSHRVFPESRATWLFRDNSQSSTKHAFIKALY